MRWDDVRYLLALRRRGSLAGAARHLRVDETTVGRRLTTLEEELGSRLFERQATGHRLTAAGVRACDLGEAMESSAEALQRELGGRDVGVEGKVRITAPAGFVPLVTRVLAEVVADHPRLDLELLVDTAALDLARREADIAVRMVRPEQTSLVVRRIGQLPWALFASETYLRRHGAPSHDLEGHAIIGYEAPLSRSPGASWLAQHAPKARIALRTNNAQAAVDGAAAGIGIAAIPAFMAADRASLERLARPREVGSSPVFLASHRDVAKIPRVKATLDRLQQSLRRTLG